MLKELRVRNFAIFEDTALEFEPGFNVLTGETGAGKTLLTRALSLACGEKASVEWIRTGCEEAFVEALFLLDDRQRKVAAEAGLPAEAEVLVRRQIARGGRTRTHWNGTPVPLGLLERVARHLVQVHGQFEHTELLDTEQHRELLDRYARLGTLRAEMEAAYQVLREADERLRDLRRSARERSERAELLRFQLEELEKVDPRPGEDAELEAERSVLAHAEQLLRGACEAEEILYSGEGAVCERLGKIAFSLRDLARIDPRLAEAARLLEGAEAETREAAAVLRAYADGFDFDPEKKARVEERLFELRRLQKKYGKSLEEIVTLREAIREELHRMGSPEADPEKLERERNRLAERARGVAAELSRRRHEAARELERSILPELSALGMPRARFRVEIRPRTPSEGDPFEGLAVHGRDEIEFFFGANPGHEERPLRRVASGGELSRILLALRVLATEEDEKKGLTLLFDEVDAGIGGKVAEAVGERLRRLGREGQVLCVTHLPQIAALADHHYAVRKVLGKTRTTAEVRKLEGKERLTELSRMLGAENDDAARRFARRLTQKPGRKNPHFP
ncbi:MAG: DNA repair protein RecN [Candidatus Binatia bacterium]|nr:MAG: DNA repair protein RecN [Candidatus Binatia bacterium]